MKNKILFGIIAGLVFWNIWLSLPEKKEGETVNKELYIELFKQSERRFRRFENEIKRIDYELKKDSVFLVNPTRSERDSLRARFNPG